MEFFGKFMLCSNNNRNKVETEILLLLKEIFEATNARELSFANKDILDLLKKNVP